MGPVKVTAASRGAAPLEQPLSAAKIRYYDISVYKNELAETLRVPTHLRGITVRTRYVLVDADGTLTILPGFPWDGASGPTWDTPSSVRGSCVHDAMYFLERKGLIDVSWRAEADRLIRAICIEDGMWEWRAEIWYKVLRTFAAGAAKADAKMEAFERVIEAP